MVVLGLLAEMPAVVLSYLALQERLHVWDGGTEVVKVGKLS